MAELRVFERIARPMQRLGYLKRLVKRVTVTSSASMDSLGNDLIDNVSKKIKVQLNQERVDYIRGRLLDRTYRLLKEQAQTWVKSGGEAVEVQMELQDLYLADPRLPSKVGKLVKEDWRKYPGFGTNLGLIRSGTFSANTRAISFLSLIPDLEQQAFLEYLPESNPLSIDRKQGLLLLFSLIENDGEVVAPLWGQLIQKQDATFNDREAGSLLPEIYAALGARHRKRVLPLDLRERLAALEKSATYIIAQREKEGYEGGGAREEASRLRLEPYADIGLLGKENAMRYEYFFLPAGKIWAVKLGELTDSAAIERFLDQEFFQTAARAWELPADKIVGDAIIPQLYPAWKTASSATGYAPIMEFGLLAGIQALLEEGKLFEIGQAREALIAYQKANPYAVRFTVDRLGNLAHAKFMEIPGTRG